MGAISTILVLLCLTLFVAVIGGTGVAAGIAGSGAVFGRLGPWAPVGGALGGLLVGGFGKLLGLDAFHLMLGRSPGDITGALEGAMLGAGVGLGAWLAHRRKPRSLGHGITLAGLAGAGAGLLAVAAGGNLMGGSLDLLARQFPDSQFRLDSLGLLFGEDGFGPVSRAATGAGEGFLFGACIVGAMLFAGTGRTTEADATRRPAMP